jgi:hypothetical protein
MAPLPNGSLPADQTIEGGAQVRVTPAGFTKLTAIVPAVLNDSLDDGFCLGENQVVDAGIAEASICSGNDGMCTPGCQIDILVDSVDMSVPQDDTFNVRVQFDLDADIRIDYEVFWVISGNCNVDATLNDGVIDVDIAFGIDPATGELTINLDQIRQLDISGLSLSGCGGLADIVDAALGLVSALLDSFLGDFILDFLTPVIDDLIQGFLPDPLGLEGVMDLGDMLGSVSPGTSATMEMRMVPGGYVALQNGGLSLGIITGINADEDLATRTPDLDSEPAFCVPPMAAPDFSAPPASLATTARQTFSLLPAGEFQGAPDPAFDMAIGLSETTLDLIGHHAVTSGAMCLGVGTALSDQLNLGTIGILVPSLAELGSEDGTDPLLLVTRPQKPLDFAIGEGTEEDPSLSISIQEFEIDFYAFLFERFVRGFTIKIGMEIGLNLEYTTDEDGNPAIMPVLTGLETDAIELTVLNTEFLREDVDTLEAVLPTVFDLAIPLLADGLGAFSLPDFAGFTMTDLQTAKIVTSEDEFLAIYANLGTAQMAAGLGEIYPSVKQVMADMAIEQGPKTTTRAGLRSVVTPDPATIRTAIVAENVEDFPTVTIDVEPYDDQGRPLEYTWNISGGINRPFTQANPIVIRDRALLYQGKYDINLRARVVGDYTTLDQDEVTIPVVIDSVGPRIHAHLAYAEGTEVVFPSNDLVSDKDTLEFAFGVVGSDEPYTAWRQSNRASFDELRSVLDSNSIVTVYARDELGNQTATDVDLGPVINFHGSAEGSGGCDCSSTGDSASIAGLGLMLLLTGFLLFGRRRATVVLRKVTKKGTTAPFLTVAVWVGISISVSMTPGCSCEGDPGGDVTCEVDEDCADLCVEGEIPICFDNVCVCADDVPMGRIGQHSDLDISSGGAAWVSAYNSIHGDLMVAKWENSGRIENDAWEFVDGVPEGPIVLPQSEIRNGIFAAGEHVGQYTSMAVSNDDTPMTSYYDVDNASLKFAALYQGIWKIHTIEEGAIGGDPELGFTVVGQYSSISVNPIDGRPAIAYFAQIADGAGMVRTEVRYASAQTTTPGAAADWSIWVVDAVDVPAPGPDDAPDIYPIPEGTGLFITTARVSDGSPVVVYYNRMDGDLMLARFDTVAGAFMAPEIIDGAGVDVGWYPSVAVDATDELHFSYVSATNDDLLYINTIDRVPEIVDDGYRIVGTTDDGLPKPEFHFVGDDSSIVMTQVGPVITYQDATSHELLVSQRNSSGLWEFTTLAGAEDPFAGGYGFYAASVFDGDQVVVSNWVINQPANDVWVEIFRRTIAIE